MPDRDATGDKWFLGMLWPNDGSDVAQTRVYPKGTLNGAWAWISLAVKVYDILTL